MTIPRCQHIRVNGTQCGSPALRTKRFCYFHSRHQLKPTRDSLFDFPVLEDANAIQIALMQVIRAIADNKIESKRAGLLLYALQTASYNLKRTKLQPEISEAVLDTSSLAQQITPPPDPVELMRAMRRTYWTMRDPELIRRDREIVARDCAAPEAASDHPITRSPDHPIARNSQLATAPRSPDESPLTTRNSQPTTAVPPIDTRPPTTDNPSPEDRELLMKIMGRFRGPDADRNFE